MTAQFHQWEKAPSTPYPRASTLFPWRKVSPPNASHLEKA